MILPGLIHGIFGLTSLNKIPLNVQAKFKIFCWTWKWQCMFWNNCSKFKKEKQYTFLPNTSSSVYKLQNFHKTWYMLHQTWQVEERIMIARTETRRNHSSLLYFQSMMKGFHKTTLAWHWPPPFKSYCVRGQMEAKLMSLHVKWQVIRSWEASVTVCTFEWLCTSVFPVMSC